MSRVKPNYFFIPLFVIITASAASYFAETGRAWYKTINLPDWTPSGSIMVLAWTIIFILKFFISAYNLEQIFIKKKLCTNHCTICSQCIINCRLEYSFFLTSANRFSLLSGCVTDCKFNPSHFSNLAFVSFSSIFTCSLLSLCSILHCAYF